MSKTPIQPVFLVDEEKDFLEKTSTILKKNGFDNFRLIYKPEKLESVLQLLNESCIIIFHATETNLEIIKNLSKKFFYIPKIAIADGEINEKYFEYITYIIDIKEAEKKLSFVLKKSIEIYDLYKERENLKKTVFSEEGLDFSSFDKIITKNEKMLSAFKYLKAVSKSNNPILLVGEFGVNKNQFAEALNKELGLSGNFFEIHPDQLELDTRDMQKIFFGEIKEDGTLIKGIMQEAENGVLYIKEINKLDKKKQNILYNLITEKKFYPVNSAYAYFSTAKIIVGARKNITDLKREGQIIEDLYYTLRTFQVFIPPLRERLDDDLLLLTNEFIRKHCKKFNKKRPVLDEKTIDLLFSYDYPGNVNELESIIAYAISKNGNIEKFHEAIKEYISEEKKKRVVEDYSSEDNEKLVYFKTKKLPTIDEATKELIKVALVRSGFRFPVAAKFLGITKNKLQKLLVEYNIDINKIEEKDL